MLVNVSFDRLYNFFRFFSIHWVIFFHFKLNMEQSFENENTCDICMNEIKIGNEPLQEHEENATVSNQCWMGTHLG